MLEVDLGSSSNLNEKGLASLKINEKNLKTEEPK